MLRLIISPSPRAIELPAGYKLGFGIGTVLRDGSDAAIFGYGYVLLHEALVASELLEKKGFSLKVINMPWLNHVDSSWLEDTVGKCRGVFVLDDHSPYGGLGDSLLNEISTSGRRFVKLGVESYPACGTPQEALSYHGLDGKSLAERIIGQTV
jgi:transketolase